MNDPRVVAVHYQLAFEGDVQYRAPQFPVTFRALIQTE
jgi:hypothetical protein